MWCRLRKVLKSEGRKGLGHSALSERPHSKKQRFSMPEKCKKKGRCSHNLGMNQVIESSTLARFRCGESNPGLVGSLKGELNESLMVVSDFKLFEAELIDLPTNPSH